MPGPVSHIDFLFRHVSCSFIAVCVMHVDAQTILRQAWSTPLAHRLDSRHSQQGMPSEQTVASPEPVSAERKQLQVQRCLFQSNADQQPINTGNTDAHHLPAAEAASMGCLLRQGTCCSRRPAELLQALNAAVHSFEAAGQLAMQQRASARKAQHEAHLDSSDTSSQEDGTTSEDSSSCSSPRASTPGPHSRQHSVLQQQRQHSVLRKHHLQRDRGAGLQVRHQQGQRRPRRSTGHASPKPAQLMHRYALAAAACACVLLSRAGASKLRPLPVEWCWRRPPPCCSGCSQAASSLQTHGF